MAQLLIGTIFFDADKSHMHVILRTILFTGSRVISSD